MFADGFDYSRLPVSWKLLLTGFIFILGMGYLSAALNAKLAVGLSPAAIAGHYGDKSLSAEEKTMIEKQGFVEEEFSFADEDDMAGMEHDGMPMAGHGGLADDTLPAQALVQLSHIHLLGFALLLLAIGGLTCLTRLPEMIKASLVTVLCLSFFGDIAGLSLTRFVSDDFAWVTMVTGTMIGVCLALMILRVFWELWWPVRR